MGELLSRALRQIGDIERGSEKHRSADAGCERFGHARLGEAKAALGNQTAIAWRQQIEEERATLAAVMASMNDGLLVFGSAREVRYCNARTGALLQVDPAVLVQEGGYARTYAAYCLHATLEGVLDTGPLLADPIGYLPDDASRGDADIAALRTYLSPFWSLP